MEDSKLLTRVEVDGLHNILREHTPVLTHTRHNVPLHTLNYYNTQSLQSCNIHFFRSPLGLEIEVHTHEYADDDGDDDDIDSDSPASPTRVANVYLPQLGGTTTTTTTTTTIAYATIYPFATFGKVEFASKRSMGSAWHFLSVIWCVHYTISQVPGFKEQTEPYQYVIGVACLEDLTLEDEVTEMTESSSYTDQDDFSPPIYGQLPALFKAARESAFKLAAWDATEERRRSDPFVRFWNQDLLEGLGEYASEEIKQLIRRIAHNDIIKKDGVRAALRKCTPLPMKQNPTTENDSEVIHHFENGAGFRMDVHTSKTLPNKAYVRAVSAPAAAAARIQASDQYCEVRFERTNPAAVWDTLCLIWGVHFAIKRLPALVLGVYPIYAFLPGAGLPRNEIVHLTWSSGNLTNLFLFAKKAAFTMAKQEATTTTASAQPVTTAAGCTSYLH